jgi:hypothetical protein
MKCKTFLLLVLISSTFASFPYPQVWVSFQMVLDNIKLCLSEDRPSANITSPGPIPINLEISELVISRGLDGVFHIEPPGDLTVKYICSCHVKFVVLMMANVKITFCRMWCMLSGRLLPSSQRNLLLPSSG